MTIYDPPGRGRIIDMQGGSMARVAGFLVLGLLIVVFLVSAVTRVDSGAVGVLTLFGRVTGEALPEGIHLINPLKTNHELSIRTQEIKETASVPSSEGLVMNLDTSLIYHLNPDKAAEVYQKIGPTTWRSWSSPTCGLPFVKRPLRTPQTPSTPASARWLQNRSLTNSPIFWASAA